LANILFQLGIKVRVRQSRVEKSPPEEFSNIFFFHILRISAEKPLGEVSFVVRHELDASSNELATRPFRVERWVHSGKLKIEFSVKIEPGVKERFCYGEAFNIPRESKLKRTYDPKGEKRGVGYAEGCDAA
jgi:hypothetical protein